jgi:phosphate transport system substrate-binding protein
MLIRRSLASFCALSFALAVFPSAHAQEKLKVLSGGPSVIKALEKIQADIDKAAGKPVEFSVTPVQSGFVALSKDLVGGVMVADDPAHMIKAGAKENGGLNPDDFQWIALGEGLLKFALHPDNPVNALTKAQVTDILTGKITSWEKIGGKAQAITIYMITQNRSAEGKLLQFYTGSDKISEKVTNLKTVYDRPGVVRAIKTDPGAFAFLTTRMSNPDFKPKYIDSEAVFPMYLVVRKTPNAAAKGLVDFFKKRGPIRTE